MYGGRTYIDASRVNRRFHGFMEVVSRHWFRGWWTTCRENFFDSTFPLGFTGYFPESIDTRHGGAYGCQHQSQHRQERQVASSVGKVIKIHRLQGVKMQTSDDEYLWRTSSVLRPFMVALRRG